MERGNKKTKIISNGNFFSVLDEAKKNLAQRDKNDELRKFLPQSVSSFCLFVDVIDNRVIFYFSNHVILGEVVAFHKKQIIEKATQVGYEHVSFKLMEK